MIQGVDFLPSVNLWGDNPGGIWLKWLHSGSALAQVSQQLQELRQRCPLLDTISIFVDFRMVPYTDNKEELANLKTFAVLANEHGFKLWLLAGTHLAVSVSDMNEAQKDLSVAGRRKGDRVGGRVITTDVPFATTDHVAVAMTWYKALAAALDGKNSCLVLCGNPFVEFATEIGPLTWEGNDNLKPLVKSFWQMIAGGLREAFPGQDIAVSLMPRFPQSGDPSAPFNDQYGVLKWAVQLLERDLVDFIDLTSWPGIQAPELLDSIEPWKRSLLLSDFTVSRAFYNPPVDMYQSAARQVELVRGNGLAGFWFMGNRDHKFPGDPADYQGLKNDDGTWDEKMIQALGVGPLPPAKPIVREGYLCRGLLFLRADNSSDRVCINLRSEYEQPMLAWYCTDSEDRPLWRLPDGVLVAKLQSMKEQELAMGSGLRVWVCNEAGCSEGVKIKP